jgi:hypothetical protein
MSSSVDSDAAKKGDALIPATADRAQSGDGPRMLTERALLRLEEALRAQHKQAGRQRPFSAVDAATSQPGSSGVSLKPPIIRGRIEQIAESPPLAPGAGQSQIPTEQHVPSRSSRRRKVGLVLCSLLLVLGPAFLEGSLKSPTGGLIDVAPINNEPGGRTVSMPPDNNKPHLSIPNTAKSSATESASSPPGAPDQQPVEAQSPRALETPITPAPSDERTVEPQSPAALEARTPVLQDERAVEPHLGPAAPAASEMVHRHRAVKKHSNRKGSARRRFTKR